VALDDAGDDHVGAFQRAFPAPALRERDRPVDVAVALDAAAEHVRTLAHDRADDVRRRRDESGRTGRHVLDAALEDHRPFSRWRGQLSATRARRASTRFTLEARRGVAAPRQFCTSYVTVTAFTGPRKSLVGKDRSRGTPFACSRHIRNRATNEERR